MMKKLVFVWMAAVAMLMSCQEKDGNQDNAVKSFETMKVSKQDITLSMTYPAQIEGRQSVKIIPRVEGYLRQICGQSALPCWRLCECHHAGGTYHRG